MTTPDYLYRKAFFMADRNDVHVLIGSKHNKWSHNSNDDSWYAENFTQGGASEDRASFHYPNLERWLLRATQRYERGESKYNPFSGKNLAFVLHDKETEGTATVMVSPNVMEYARKIFRTDKDFVVEMFDWDLETLSSEQLMAIFNDIHRSFVTCSFSDTLGIATPTTLVAQVKTPALPALGKTNKRRIKEEKNMKTNVVKINEQQLRSIISESIKKVLEESVLNETFQSSKIMQYAQQHQGIKNVTSLNPYQKTNINIATIPDNQIQNIVPCDFQSLGNVARQVANGVTLHFNDGTIAVVQISGKSIPVSNRANQFNQGTGNDGQFANPSIGMQRYRNQLAKNNPEARRQMTGVLNKTRGNYNV